MRPAASAPSPSAQRAAPADTQPVRILVVDDCEINRCVAEGYLARLGYQVMSVASGHEAIDAVATGEYAAVLMDYQMPGMDGCTATREIRQREHPGPRIPILAWTASIVPGVEEHCLQAGMDMILPKPFQPEELRSALQSVLPPAAARPGR